VIATDVSLDTSPASPMCMSLLSLSLTSVIIPVRYSLSRVAIVACSSVVASCSFTHARANAEVPSLLRRSRGAESVVPGSIRG
jgi:hypothetical protein